MKYFIYISLIVSFLFFSCEKGKPLNMEADILSIELYAGENGNELIGYKSSVIDTDVPFFIPTLNNYSNIKTIISVTDGATLYPPSGEFYDFSKPVDFTVTSEDGEWKRIYSIKIDSIASWKFNFEEWNVISSGSMSYMEPVGWTSANKGVMILVDNLGIDFPTYRTSDSYSGDYALEMCTRFGKLNGGVVPPLISGSAFIGNFNTNYLMTDNLQCPEFGVPFSYNGINKPSKLVAKFKYVPGPVFTDEHGDVVVGKVDKYSFYAVFYWGEEPMNARNMNSTNRVIAKATLDYDLDYSNYTHIEVPFDYKSYGGSIPVDQELRLSIVAGSSQEGDFYRGAVGSTLTLDDVEIIFE